MRQVLQGLSTTDRLWSHSAKIHETRCLGITRSDIRPEDLTVADSVVPTRVSCRGPGPVDSHVVTCDETRKPRNRMFMPAEGVPDWYRDAPGKASPHEWALRHRCLRRNPCERRNLGTFDLHLISDIWHLDFLYASSRGGYKDDLYSRQLPPRDDYGRRYVCVCV